MKNKAIAGSRAERTRTFPGLPLVALAFTVIANQSVSAAPQWQAMNSSPGTIGAIKTEQKETGLTTLRQAIKDSQVSLSVQGDGYTTSSVRLLLTNKTKLPLKLVIPANEVLHPNTSAVQTMMITKDMVVTLPVGQVTIAEVPTVCASVKTVPPPPKDGVNFEVGPYADAKLWRQLSAIIAAASELDRSGAFASVPINTGRIDQIAQLAVWRVLGLASGKPEHAVTPETIQADLLKAVADQVKKNPELLKQLGDGYELSPKGELIVTKRQKKALDERVASIFDAVDLTVKRSTDPGLKSVASLPQDSTWDTYVNVGERSYHKGDYVEAEELLSQAVQEAEVFGEADARLSRSMTSLAKCYLDLSWWEKAEALFNRALKLREKVTGASSPEVAEVSQYLGLLKQHQKLYGAAEEQFKRPGHI
ncbi:MAG: tetratricopeptide repeat protein [Candidatus Obscuribacter sp.]|nr:tetratricopeptide repeat protein [Candidatus Obscuribacter sp.]